MLFDFACIYFVCISIFAVIITVYDKKAAQNGRWRISESFLLISAILGGSVAMLITMQTIRHKTKKPKFMIGIPAIILLQIAVVLFVMVKL